MRRGWIERVRYCKTQAGEFIRGPTKGPGGDIVDSGISHGGDKQWPTLFLHRLTHRMIIPERNTHFFRHLFRLPAHRLPQGQPEPRRGIGYILTQYQHRVRQLHFMQ